MITARELGSLLKGIANKDEHGNNYYLEDDLIDVLNAIGIPSPDWSFPKLDVDDYLKIKEIRKNSETNIY